MGEPLPLYLSQLLLPFMVKKGLFADPRFSDLPPPEVWEDGFDDITVELLEDVVDALDATLVRKHGDWILFHGNGPARRTLKP